MAAGSGFGHFALAVPDVYQTVDSIKKAGTTSRLPTPETSQTHVHSQQIRRVALLPQHQDWYMVQEVW